MSFTENEYRNGANNRKKAEQIACEISNALRESVPFTERSNGDVIAAAYVLFKAAQFKNTSQLTYEQLSLEKLEIAENTVRCFGNIVNNNAWNALRPLLLRYTSDDFAAAVFMPTERVGQTGEPATPESIVKLALRILDCKDGDAVADIGCGVGTFLLAAASEVHGAKYVGYEINEKRKTIADMRAEVIGCKIDFRLQDAFSVPDKDCGGEKYDKVFANYPFGMKLRNLGEDSKYLNRLLQMYPDISKATSADWVFNSLLCDLLKPGGKAVGIMTNGSTWNSIDAPMRRYFTKRGLIESVVSLPNRMFTTTNIATSLIVLSRGNKSVRLVDASEICRQGRRLNEFDSGDIDAICSALSEDSDISRSVTVEELGGNEYALNLSRYCSLPITFENALPFEAVIRSISRGAPCTAKQLDNMVSDKITDMQYLMLTNIQNGMIDEKLPYLSHIEPRYEKYCLHNNNLILSKNGYPYKVAVAHVENGQKILANGNLYIIEIDEKKANPYYLKAFFESEQGISVLKSITVGATIPNIGVDKLKKAMIPIPPLSEQNRIARKYQAALDEVTAIKRNLEKAMDRLHHVFDEENGAK